MAAWVVEWLGMRSQGHRWKNVAKMRSSRSPPCCSADSSLRDCWDRN